MLSTTVREKADSSPDELRQLIASVLYGGHHVHLSYKDGATDSAFAQYDEASDRIILSVAPDKLQTISTITIDGYNTSYSFAAAGLASPDEPNKLSLPTRLKRQQRRAKMRAMAPAGWELRYLDVDNVTARRQLRDVSLDGANILGSAIDESHFFGRILRPVDVFDNEEKICSLVAELCNVTYVSGKQNKMGFGLRLRALSKENWSAWESKVNAVIHPNTRDGREMSDEIWSLFSKSGYFNLSDKRPEDFLEQRVVHEGFNSILDKNPELGAHTIWHGGGEVQASISTCMPYSHTALLHQMAKIPGTGENRVVLRDMLIHSFEYMKQQPSLHWVAALLNAKVIFNQFAFLAFAESERKRERADIVKFQLIEFSTNENVNAQKGVTVTDALPSDFPLIAEHIRRARGAIYADAFDQTEEKLSADVSKLRWRDVGISRDRRILIARDGDGQRLAASIVDVSPAGSNLFSVFDAFTIVSLIDGVAEIEKGVIDLLLSVSKRWLSRIGRKKFVWHRFHNIEHGGAEALHGGTDLGMGRLWIISREAIPDLQEYWYTHMMRPRKSRQDSKNRSVAQASQEGGEFKV